MTSKKLYFFTVVLLCVSQFMSAQINKVTLQTKNPRLYEKVDIDVNLISQWENPYLQEDVALDMKIVTPSGKKLSLPCFYASGESNKESLWQARFTPQEVGSYQYSFTFSKSGKPVSDSQTQKFTVKKSNKSGFLHPKDNWTLQFDNGKPFRGVGENICWESRASDDSKFFKDLHQESKYNYEYLLPLLAKSGGNFYRTWMCRWNLPIDWKNGFNNNRYTPSDAYYNPSAIAKFDRMVNLNDSLGLYLMLTLGEGASGVREGGFATGGEDFFVNPKAKERYKNRLRYIVARWGYSTSIGMWEFFNEIDNVQFRDNKNPIRPEAIVEWHKEMSAYLKQIDPYKHIVTTSISHRDIEGLNSIDHIDINQKHIYKNTSVMPSEIIKYEEKFKKPYVIGEFGFEWDWSKNFNDFAEDMDADFRRGLWYGLFSPTPVLPMSWWWEFFEERGMMPYIKSVREINDKMLAAGNGSFEMFPIEAENLDAFCVKCGKEVFVYFYNGSDSPVNSNAIIKNINNQIKKSQSFNPENLKYQGVNNIESKSGNISIKSISLNSKKELVYILTLNL